MKVKKKKSNNTPRHKRLNRKQRLQAAKNFIESYTGNNIVKGYKKHFAVDWMSAFKELEMLGISIDKEYKENLIRSLQSNAERKRKLKQEKLSELEDDEFSNDEFFFIAGYTPGGFPYGIRWDEVDENGEFLQPEESYVIRDDSYIDPYADGNIPF